MADEQASSEMPKYRCHKVVHALKIEKIWIDERDGCVVFTPADHGFGLVRLDAAFVAKHQPDAGGYYVVYEDGYRSFSPATAFESGYTRI